MISVVFQFVKLCLIDLNPLRGFLGYISVGHITWFIKAPTIRFTINLLLCQKYIDIQSLLAYAQIG